MKIFNIQIFNPAFKGQRQDRKTISQLKEENKYNLNVPNQRRISNAIDNLAKVPGEDNIDFLIDVADNLKYGTNIDLGKKSYNDWHSKLEKATKNSYNISDNSIQEKVKAKIEQSFNEKKPLTNTEKEILENRKELLQKVDYEALEKISNSNIKSLKRNLDYFIVSSEVSTPQKLYILKRLNYFMSPEYKINPQLKDKKTQALAEMVNDIVINTPESKIPNIKAINQQQHGICAAISICRKLLAYEDKSNYIDMILSELDDKDYMEVYDITKLGTHTKIPIEKCNIDFDYALKNGYRIVDTSAMYWMNVADTAGAVNEPVGYYSSFDKTNFDTFKDMHISADLPKDLVNKQDYYRALLVAQNKIEQCKKDQIEQKYMSARRSSNQHTNIEDLTKSHNTLNHILKGIAPNSTTKEILELRKAILSLEVKDTKEASKINDYRKYFIYLKNESNEAKLEKIKAFLNIAIQGNKNSKIIAQKAPEILELSDLINHNAQNKSHPPVIKKVKRLYDAAAAYRTQTVFQLDIPERLNDLRMSLDMSDDETRVLENMNSLIKKLQKGELNPEIREQLTHNFGVNNTDKDLEAVLMQNKQTLEYILTDLMDDLYQCSLSINRKAALSNELKNIKDELENNPNKIIITQLSKNLKVEENKKEITDKLNNYIEKLDSKDCSEDEYLKIYRQMGHTSHLKDYKELFERLGHVLFDEPNEDIIRGFNALNGGNPDLPIENTLELYKKLADNFNKISSVINSFQKGLRVTDSENNILNTTDAKEIIVKHLENMGEIISKKDLQLLNKRFVKIDNLMNTKEEGKTRVKDLPKELTTLTPYEKDLVRKMEQNINPWYSMVTRKLDAEYRELKDDLNNLYKQIGTKRGLLYVNAEGHSGLINPQEVKIIEHMTDRPYYIEYDGDTAIKKIKQSPYSGISNTSVSDTEMAAHAQYVVDVKPVKIKNGDKYETKDILVHDNTWGAIEHENTWVDENGMLRTDYNSEYGGQLGYITDENYRNGKLTENLFNKVGTVHNEKNIDSKLYKKINKYDDLEGYKFPLFSEFIAPGKYPNSMQYVQMIRENTLLSPIAYINDLEKYAKSMTKEEIQSAIKKVETAGIQTNDLFEKYLNRIKGDEILNNGIKTKAEYDKLSNNDPLKIVLEKLALIKSYSGIPNLKLFYKVNNVEELKQMKQAIKQEARTNFDYVFAKNPDITKYGTESVRYPIYKMLDNLAEKNNIKINQNTKLHIVNSMKQINPKDFNGKLDDTIDLMINNLSNSITTKTPSFKDKQEQINALANTVKTLLQTNMGFTLADLNSSSFAAGDLQNIVNWIDKTFNPATDEEFVQIFNKLRNMTKEEFNRKFNSKISDSDIGLKEITGYEILKQIRSENNKTIKSFRNLIYTQERSIDLELSKTKPFYNYNKFTRIYNGGLYVNNKRSFDDIYSDYYYSLLILNNQKYVKRLSHAAFQNYKLFFGFPEINPESDEAMKDILNNLYNNINNDMDAIVAFKAQIKSFDIIKSLQKTTSRLEQDKPITARQRTAITKKLNEFCQINAEDETIQDVLDKIKSTIEKGTTGKDFSDLVNYMWTELSPYQTTISGKNMEDSIKDALKSINDTKNDFIQNMIEPRYRHKASELLNRWISMKVKISKLPIDSPNVEKLQKEAEKIYIDFLELYEKHRIFQSPEKILNEFLLMSAKDARPQNIHTSGDKAIQEMKNFEDKKNSYKTMLKGLLLNSNLLEIQYILMECAFNGSLNIVRDSLKNSKLELKNGTETTLDSDIGLNILLSPMLNEDNLETALMFIEQLGLSERVIETATKNFKAANSCRNIKRIYSILNSSNEQVKFAKQEVENLKDLDKDPNYMNRILESKERILKKIARTNYRITSKIYEKAIDNAISQMEQKPDMPKYTIFASNIDMANDAAIYVAKQNVAKINEKLANVQIVSDLIRKLQLPENSPAVELRKKYLEEYKKIEEYKGNFEKNYKDIGVSTEE